jgi:hypothetical protein
METMETTITADAPVVEAKKPRRGFVPEGHHLEAAEGSLHKEIIARVSLQLRSGVEVSVNDATAVKAAVRFNETASDFDGENIEDAATRLGVKSGFMLNTLKGVRRGRPITTKNAIDVLKALDLVKTLNSVDAVAETQSRYDADARKFGVSPYACAFHVGVTNPRYLRLLAGLDEGRFTINARNYEDVNSALRLVYGLWSRTDWTATTL